MTMIMHGIHYKDLTEDKGQFMKQIRKVSLGHTRSLMRALLKYLPRLPLMGALVR